MPLPTLGDFFFSLVWRFSFLLELAFLFMIWTFTCVGGLSWELAPLVEALILFLYNEI